MNMISAELVIIIAETFLYCVTVVLVHVNVPLVNS